MMRKLEISRFTLINLLLFSLLIGTFVSPLIYSGVRHRFGFQHQNAGPLSSEEQQVAVALQNSYMNVFRKSSPSVVSIRTNVLVPPRFWFEFHREVEGAGSGFIIDREGYIVTNNHVVEGAQKIEVIFQDGTRVPAQIIGRDATSDVALIKVPPSPTLEPALLGDSDQVEAGQLAFALGAPFGLESTFTNGVISAKHRSIDNSRYSRIQTDATVNPGNSGGPLLNIFGEVVGINQSIISPGGQGGGSVGIGFAIPINEAIDVIDQLKSERRAIGRPALGVSVGLPSDTYREYLGIGRDDGLVIRFVVPGSAAEKAGLRENDFILRVDGDSVESPEELVRRVQRAGIGGRLRLDLIRDGQRLSIDVAVGEDSPD